MKKTIKYLYKLAFNDLCTGLKNRNALEEKMKRFRNGKEKMYGLHLVFIDVDNLKHINDTYGHYAGDEAIRIVGKCIREVFDKKDFCARYGGDEFVCMTYRENENKVRRLQYLLEKESEYLEYSLKVSVGTVGYEYLTDSGIDSMMKRCNAAMRKKKKKKV